MSTKIYEGLRAVEKNPFDAAKQIKAVIEPLFAAKFEAALVKALDSAETDATWRDTFGPIGLLQPEGSELHRLDGERIAAEGAWAYAVATKLYRVIELLRRTSEHTFTELDFGYEVCLIPDGRGSSRRPLVLLFSERSGDEYRTALAEAGVVETFGYWDSTDRPKHLTAAQWRQRKRAWDGWYYPRELALTFGVPHVANVAYDAWRSVEASRLKDTAQEAE